MSELDPVSAHNIEIIQKYENDVLESYKRQIEEDGHSKSLEAYAMHATKEIMAGVMHQIAAQGPQGAGDILASQFEFVITTMIKLGMTIAPEFVQDEPLCRCYLDNPPEEKDNVIPFKQPGQEDHQPPNGFYL